MNSLDFSVIDGSPGSASGCLQSLRRWRRQNPAAKFADFLAASPIDSTELLIELATADLINQLADGHARRCEDYIGASHLIADKKEHVLDLIDAEICARSDRGDVIDPNEFLQRFPTLHDELERILEIHAIDLDANRTDHQSSLNRSNNPRMISTYCLLEPLSSSTECKYWIAQHTQSAQQVILFWFTLPDDSSSLSAESNQFDATPLDPAALFSVLKQLSESRHPQLQPIVDFGLDNGQVFVAFQNSSGKLLSEFPAGVHSESEIATLICKVIDADQFVANHGIDYCEMRPADILIKPNNDCQVLDFGLSHLVKKFLGGDQQNGSHQNGPSQPGEQSRELGAAVREFGVLLFSICVDGADADEMVEHLQHGFAPLQLRQINESVSADLNAIYLSCVHRKTNHRYDSVESLRDDLLRLIRDEKVAAINLQRKRFFNWKFWSS